MSDHHDCSVCPCATPGSTHCPCLHRVERDLFDRAEWQTWVRASTLPSGVAMTEEVSIEVRDGKAQITESVLAQLLVDAGWERAS